MAISAGIKSLELEQGVKEPDPGVDGTNSSPMLLGGDVGSEKSVPVVLCVPPPTDIEVEVLLRLGDELAKLFSSLLLLL